MGDSNEPRRRGPVPRPRTEQAIEDLVLACLDAPDPAADLLERTRDCRHLRARALRVLDRVLREEPPREPPSGAGSSG